MNKQSRTQKAPSAGPLPNGFSFVELNNKLNKTAPTGRSIRVTPAGEFTKQKYTSPKNWLLRHSNQRYEFGSAQQASKALNEHFAEPRPSGGRRTGLDSVAASSQRLQEVNVKDTQQFRDDIEVMAAAEQKWQAEQDLLSVQAELTSTRAAHDEIEQAFGAAVEQRIESAERDEDRMRELRAVARSESTGAARDLARDMLMKSTTHPSNGLEAGLLKQALPRHFQVKAQPSPKPQKAVAPSLQTPSTVDMGKLRQIVGDMAQGMTMKGRTMSEAELIQQQLLHNPQCHDLPEPVFEGMLTLYEQLKTQEHRDWVSKAQPKPASKAALVNLFTSGQRKKRVKAKVDVMSSTIHDDIAEMRKVRAAHVPAASTGQAKSPADAPVRSVAPGKALNKKATKLGRWIRDLGTVAVAVAVRQRANARSQPKPLAPAFNLAELHRAIKAIADRTGRTAADVVYFVLMQDPTCHELGDEAFEQLLSYYADLQADDIAQFSRSGMDALKEQRQSDVRPLKQAHQEALDHYRSIVIP